MIFPELADYTEWGLLALRIAIAIVFVVHGWPKVVGAKNMVEQMMGGPNTGATAFFTAQGVVEVVGGVALALGVLTQVVAIIFGVIMLGAIVLKITQMKMAFMAQEAVGWEFDFILLAALILLLFAGPGDLAIQS
jgi:putative oxidoreductase